MKGGYGIGKAELWLTPPGAGWAAFAIGVPFNQNSTFSICDRLLWKAFPFHFVKFFHVSSHAQVSPPCAARIAADARTLARTSSAVNSWSRTK